MPVIDLPTGGAGLRDVGRGEPVVAIHGFLGTARKDLARDRLADADYRCDRADAARYGASGPARDFPSIFTARRADVLHCEMRSP